MLLVYTHTRIPKMQSGGIRYMYAVCNVRVMHVVAEKLKRHPQLTNQTELVSLVQKLCII